MSGPKLGNSVIFNAAWKNPWVPPIDRCGETFDAELLELQAKANRVIPSLQNLDIRIFMGTYASWQQKPSYDFDEGCMYVRETMPKESVTNVHAVVSDEAAEHLTRIPSDHEELEEIPF